MKRSLTIFMALALAIVALPMSAALADTNTITFEPPTYAPGSINGQDGWSATGPYDQGIVLTSAYPAPVDTTGFGDQSFRMSNAVTSGGFDDQVFSPSLTDEAGETSAESGTYHTGGTRQTRFEATWHFTSATGAAQPGLSTVVSPDRGDGARMSWVQMTDTGAAGGLDVNFYDYQTGVGFVFTPIATGLSRTAAHTIKIQMDFIDGVANDIVKVWVDGSLAHTGTSWEDYFRDVEHNPTRTVDSVLFRVAGPNAPDTLGNGFLFDNLTLFSGPRDSYADLSITKTDSPDPVHIGQKLVYTIIVTNSGPDGATGVSLVDNLPKNAGYGSYTTTQGSCTLKPAKQQVTCSLGNLASGATATVTITVKPTKKGTIMNTVTVSALSPTDPDSTNNTATQYTTVLP